MAAFFSTFRAGLTTLAVAVLALTGCASADSNAPEPTESAEGSAGSAAFPITFTNADGTTTEIPAKPESILSTSVSVTGTLLAIDAPVVASAAAGNGQFFAQWAPIAEERGVELTWSAGSVDVEAAYAAEPDLIVVSTSGADSAIDQLEQFQEIAPTIVVDYGGQTWQELATELGVATGLEENAAATIDDFDAYVADAASKITVPEGTANVVSYTGPGGENPIARVGGAHAELLTALGFTIEDPDPSWHAQDNQRADFVWAPHERLTELTSATTFILSADNDKAQDFANDPVLANVPSVAAGQVYGLGANSFRIDYYSATEIVDGVVANFGS